MHNSSATVGSPPVTDHLSNLSPRFGKRASSLYMMKSSQDPLKGVSQHYTGSRGTDDELNPINPITAARITTTIN
jgi:hypothetical protein